MFCLNQQLLQSFSSKIEFSKTLQCKTDGVSRLYQTKLTEIKPKALYAPKLSLPHSASPRHLVAQLPGQQVFSPVYPRASSYPPAYAQ